MEGLWTNWTLKMKKEARIELICFILSIYLLKRIYIIIILFHKQTEGKPISYDQSIMMQMTRLYILFVS